MQDDAIMIEAMVDFGRLKTRKDIIREIEKIDKKIIELHERRFSVKRKFAGGTESEILRLKRSFLYDRLCELYKAETIEEIMKRERTKRMGN